MQHFILRRDTIMVHTYVSRECRVRVCRVYMCVFRVYIYIHIFRSSIIFTPGIPDSTTVKTSTTTKARAFRPPAANPAYAYLDENQSQQRIEKYPRVGGDSDLTRTKLKRIKKKNK